MTLQALTYYVYVFGAALLVGLAVNDVAEMIIEKRRKK